MKSRRSYAAQTAAVQASYALDNADCRQQAHDHRSDAEGIRGARRRDGYDDGSMVAYTARFK
jgi:hypothetical protein